MQAIQTELLIFLIPCFVTLFILPRFASIASELGLVDKPNRRKVHIVAKPLVGGLGMSLGVAFGCLLFLPLTNMRGYYAGAILLVVIGFFDDFREVDHRMKFIAQIVSAFLIISFSNVTLHTFGDLLHIRTINFHALKVPMTVIGFLGVINAINMVDGLDGLAGGISLIAFISFGYLAYLDNHRDIMLLSIALSGALIGFMRFNWHPARLFMGDAGSLFLGFTAAFVSVAVTQEPNSTARPVAPLLILTVPIVDTLTVMTKRLMKGKSPFYPDRTHLHHVLLKFGFSKRQTVVIMLCMSAAFSAVALAGTLLDIPEYYLFFLFLAYFFVYFSSSFFIKKVLLKRKRNTRLHAKMTPSMR
jgi:UDP-GlcNAc:undecaprenyl-phosphate GlcNAc-1-phosphate transferase